MIEKLQHALENGDGQVGVAYRTHTGSEWELGILVGVDAVGIALHPKSPQDGFSVIPWQNIVRLTVKK